MATDVPYTPPAPTMLTSAQLEGRGSAAPGTMVLDHLLRSRPIGLQVQFAGVRAPNVPQRHRTNMAALPQLRAEEHRNLRARHPNTARELSRPRVCRKCHAKYQERDNIGQWQCAYHPARRVTTHRVDPQYNSYYAELVYECCKKPEWAGGCTPCDHVETGAIGMGGECEVACVPQFLLPLDGATDQDRAACIVPPRPHTVCKTQPYPQWLCPEIRDGADICNEQEEAFYQLEFVGPRCPPTYVMRMDYWQLQPRNLNY